MAIISLKNASDFDNVFKNGRRMRGREGTVIFKPADATRLGIIVGKKHGGAVVRNRIKRLIREAFRILQPSINRTTEIVVMPDTHTPARSSDSMLNFMREAFVKAGIIKNDL